MFQDHKETSSNKLNPILELVRARLLKEQFNWPKIKQLIFSQIKWRNKINRIRDDDN